EHVMGEGQGAAGVPEAAAVVGSAVCDRQVVDLHADAAADPENPTGVIAADGQLVGAQALDVQALGDGQLPAGQRDGLAQETTSEVDRVPAVGVQDRLTQRP